MSENGYRQVAVYLPEHLLQQIDALTQEQSLASRSESLALIVKAGLANKATHMS